MKNILITGFQTFGDYRVNPTEKFLKNNNVLGDFYLHSLIFPARTFLENAENFGTEIVKTAVSLKAVAIISLGMASDVQGLRIESQAFNWSAGKYCDKSEQELKLDQRRPPWYCKSIDFKYWNIEYLRINLARRGIKFEQELSTDAGRFCCNALMYRTLTVLRPKHDNIPYIFFHIPCTAEAIEGINNFDRNKNLIDFKTLKEILMVVSTSIINRH